MTSSMDWNAGSVDLNINQLSTNQTPKTYNQITLKEDELILHSIKPSQVFLSEMTTEYNKNCEDIPSIRSLVSTNRHLKVTTDRLSELWCIGPKRADATIKVTTQKEIRCAILPIARRYIADIMYSLKQLRGRFATDTFYPKVKSLNLYTCVQIFSYKGRFVVCYTMMNASGDSIGQALKYFSHDYGVPEHLTFGGWKYTSFMKTVRK